MAETTELIDATGTATVLNVEWDVYGRGAPPVFIEEDEVPGLAGSRVRSVRHKARDFSLPLRLSGDGDDVAVRAQIRDLVARLDPTRGDVRIRITAPGGDQREITCRYQGGLELSERLGETSAPGLQRGTPMFRAHDPYWYDVSDVTDEYELGGATATWFSGKWFPLRLSNSEIFSSPTLDNPGDVEAWPVWRIRGPGSAITLRNLTTGRLLTLDLTLDDGEEVEIDTRRGRKWVRLDDGSTTGVNVFAALGSSPDLWPLAYGSNSLSVEMGSSSATSRVFVRFTPPYLTA